MTMKPPDNFFFKRAIFVPINDQSMISIYHHVKQNWIFFHAKFHWSVVILNDTGHDTYQNFAKILPFLCDNEKKLIFKNGFTRNVE